MILLFVSRFNNEPFRVFFRLTLVFFTPFMLLSIARICFIIEDLLFVSISGGTIFSLRSSTRIEIQLKNYKFDICLIKLEEQI